jgi:CHASE3 domain sensor protein
VSQLPEETIRDLQNYLREARSMPSDVSELKRSFAQHEVADERRHGEVVALTRVNAARIEAHDRRLDLVEDHDEDITGVHNIEEAKNMARDLRAERDDLLKREQARIDRDEKERRDRRLTITKWVLGTLTAAVTAVLGWLKLSGK